MITAVDTNVLLDIVRPNKEFFGSSLRRLNQAASTGSLVVCDLVYAELAVHFSSQDECDEFLRDSHIRVDGLSRATSFAASRVWRTYRGQGGKRTRILTDFLIGAHAQMQASQLLSRDRGFYRSMFPELQIVDPSAGADS